MLKSSDGSWSEEQEKVLMNQYPLHHACRDSNADSLKQVLLCLQQNISNSNLVLAEDSEYGWTAGHFASYFGSLQCLRLLQEAGKVLNSSRQSAGLPPLPCPLGAVTSRWGQTLLHVAAFAARPQCLQWLLQCGGVVQARDKNGETALHKACRSGAWDCIEILLQGGADVSVRSNKGCSPIELAIACGNAHIAEMLQAHAQTVPAPTTGLSVNHMVSSNGYYGFSAALPAPNSSSTSVPNTSSSDVDMEAESCTRNGSPDWGGGPSRGVDLLVNEGVASDTIPVAGRKRGREEEECQQSKRGRYQDEVSMASLPALHAPFEGVSSTLTSNTHGLLKQTETPFRFDDHHGSLAPLILGNQTDESISSPCSVDVWRSRGDRMSGNSTDSQDSGFCGSFGSTTISVGSPFSPSHSGLFMSNTTCTTSHTAASSSAASGWLPLAGSLDADVGSVSSTSGYSGCPIPAPAHLLACDAISTGRSRKLLGGHMF